MANHRTIAVLSAEAASPSSERSALHFTQGEVEDLNLLSYSLGSGRNACINFATKYLCSLWLFSRVPVKLPKPSKPSKTNPPLAVEFGLNPEVLASIKAVRAKRKELQNASEAEIVKPAVLYLCKKLLPPKNRRVIQDNLSAKGVS